VAHDAEQCRQEQCLDLADMRLRGAGDTAVELVPDQDPEQ